jgi:hypothetical protein
MKLLTNLFTAIAVASVGLVAQPVQASDEVCLNSNGYYVCAEIGSNLDRVYLSGKGQRERFKIQCHARSGWSFESRGTLSDSVAKAFVKGYCDGKGYTHTGPEL